MVIVYLDIVPCHELVFDPTPVEPPRLFDLGAHELAEELLEMYSNN